jgi:membrane-associated phospholipid phosphatase
VTKSITPQRPAAALPDGSLQRPWLGDIGRRIVRHFLLKLIGISAFMWAFFVAYFYLLRHPAYPILEMPLTALDRLIPFEPVAMVPYLSLWFYVGIVPGLMWTLRALIVHGLWSAGLCGVGLTCFYFWPTAVPAATLGVSDHPALALLQGVDAAGNACPSLHVATAMFSAICLESLLHRLGVPRLLRAANAAWFIAIAYSTLAVKQHVVVDVVAGALLGVVFAFAALRWRPAN